jgi:hypothetical protein
MRKPLFEMNAAEKLLRLVEIDAALLRCPPEGEPQMPIDERARLAGEWAAILKSVTSPPLHLMGEWRAGPWAEAFAAQFPSVRAEDVFAWFANAINAGTRTAYEEGEAAATQRELDYRATVFKQVGDTLETIRDGIAAGVIVCKYQLTNLETGKARPLGEYVAEALQSLGR